MLITGQVSIAAGGSVENVVAGKVAEFFRNDAHVEIALVGSATGLLATVISGEQLLMQEGDISFANRFPTEDDYFLQDDVAKGDRLTIGVRNPTAGALTLVWAVRITPL